MAKLPLIARILLGLMFLVFGLNGFFNFMPPPDLPQPAMDLMGALAATGYFLVVLKIVETLCGFLLLIGRYVPLALVLLAPVVVNIVLFHIFLAPNLGAMLPGLIALVLGIYLAYAYRDNFRGVLEAQAEPA